MSKAILIIGESGTGKSTSIRDLPHDQTFLLNVMGKALPFRGANKHYKILQPDGATGNYKATADHNALLRTINLVDKRRLDIKHLVIDDFGYSLVSNFMAKALVKGYDKFSELAYSAWEILQLMTNLRDDLFVYIMMHSDTDNNGRSKPKTIGKMLDERVCIEGLFAVVLHSLVRDGEYVFLTNNDGSHMARSPMGMFDAITIPNSLALVSTSIDSYLNEDVLQ